MVKSSGSSLHAVLIGVSDLDRSVAFYRDQVGLAVLDSASLAESGFAPHWRMSADEEGSVVVLGSAGCEVGRVMLVQSTAGKGELIRDQPGQRHYGLMNVNFYSEDINTDTKRFAALGLHAWTEPIRHAMQPSVGAPTEVMLDGPDGVIINLIELTSSELDTRIGVMRRYVKEDFGYNAKGLTPVVTTQHCVRDVEAAARFHQAVLGMSILHDDLLDKPDQNRFMDYPADARTRVIFMRGQHLFGKVALTQPLNFECGDLVPRALPGNIGYFAQAFLVNSLESAVETAAGLSAEIYAHEATGYFPGLGDAKSVIVRVPGSGALLQILQRV